MDTFINDEMEDGERVPLADDITVSNSNLLVALPSFGLYA